MTRGSCRWPTYRSARSKANLWSWRSPVEKSPKLKERTKTPADCARAALVGRSVVWAVDSWSAARCNWQAHHHFEFDYWPAVPVEENTMQPSFWAEFPALSHFGSDLRVGHAASSVPDWVDFSYGESRRCQPRKRFSQLCSLYLA